MEKYLLKLEDKNLPRCEVKESGEIILDQSEIIEVASNLKVKVFVFAKSYIFLQAGIEAEINVLGEGVTVVSLGDNTDVKINGAFVAGDQSMKIKKHFVGKNCRGHIKVHGILEKNSKSDFEGTIKIENSAGGTDSSLRENVLVLGDHIMTRSKPILEIDTDDVKAGHGASISRVNEEELFYLQSRGLSKAQATDLIKKGFLVAPFGDVPEDHILKTKLLSNV